MNKRAIILAFFFLSLMALREVPYINILFVDSFWILYAGGIFLFLLLFIPFGKILIINILTKASFLLFGVGIILTVYKLTAMAGIIGSILYFFLWIILISKIYSLIKSP